MKIKVSVPATSANIGSGFDALGLAVTLYNTVTFEESDHLDISAADLAELTCCYERKVEMPKQGQVNENLSLQ